MSVLVTGKHIEPVQKLLYDRVQVTYSNDIVVKVDSEVQMYVSKGLTMSLFLVYK